MRVKIGKIDRCVLEMRLFKWIELIVKSCTLPAHMCQSNVFSSTDSSLSSALEEEVTDHAEIATIHRCGGDGSGGDDGQTSNEEGASEHISSSH